MDGPGRTSKKKTDLAATLWKQRFLPREDLSSIATRRCWLVVDHIAVLVTATLLVAAVETSFHSAESDICRLVCFGDAVLFYFILL